MPCSRLLHCWNPFPLHVNTDPSCRSRSPRLVSSAKAWPHIMALKVESGAVAEQGALQSSNLIFDVPEYKAPLVYSSLYDISFFGLEKLHPFDSQKWGRVSAALVASGVVSQKQMVEPLEASSQDLLIAHTPAYLASLRWSINVAAITEVGGTVAATKLAVERDGAVNIGGGFHHCCASGGGGFCAYADISMAVHFGFGRLGRQRIMIVDLDAHQGNGHARDWGRDKRVYIFDMYNADIYPRDTVAKAGIARKVELKAALEEFEADLMIYNAGTDVLEGDPLGRMKISSDGVKQRDEMVFRAASGKNVPVVMLTSGGYQKNNATVIAESIINLAHQGLIKIPPLPPTAQ